MSASKREQVLAILRDHLPDLQARYGVRQIGLFGSFARDQATPTSDVDLLVELDRPCGWEIVDLRDELERLLGRRIDLVRKSALNRKSRLWDYIAGEVIYV